MTVFNFVSDFIPLLNNYEAHTGTNETETFEEFAEQNKFLDACIETPLMKETHRFLIDQGKSPKNPFDFKAQLKEIWFKFYARSQGVK